MAPYEPGMPGVPGPPKKKTTNQPYNPYPNGPYRVNDPDTNGPNTTYYPGGVDSGSQGQPQGPATPPPGPPAPTAAPTPPKTDWNAYLASDPGYAATIANLQGQEGQLLTQYGAVPAGVGLIGGGAVGSDIANAATNNPNSTLAMLRRQLSGNLQTANDSANSHGILSSGINLQNHQNEYAADQQRNYGALQQLQQALLGLGGQQSAALNNAYTNWFNYYNSQVPTGG